MGNMEQDEEATCICRCSGARTCVSVTQQLFFMFLFTLASTVSR